MEAGEILADCGYSPSECARVGDLIRKLGLGRDPEVQSLEDALCLVFLETQLKSFSKKHADEKVIDIIARSLAKMSEQGRRASSRIVLPEQQAMLVAAAIKQFAKTQSEDE